MSLDASREPPAIGGLLDLSGKTALVTGASRGIGAEIAVRIAEAGADVAVAARTIDARSGSTAARIAALGRRALPVPLDVSDHARVARAIDEIVETLGRLDILVNCAGAQPARPLLEQSADDWEEMEATNLRGVVACTREAARVLIAAGTGGAVVNVASIEGMQPAWGHSHYSATKAGVIMHTRAAALELGRHGIRVNAVSPGLIWRRGLEESWPDGVRRWLEHVPLGRLGGPDDVADAVLYLVSPMARFVSGANLVVDGGILAHPTW
jgi:3-oxoacyl-[acyl-carrier protein] reductase